MYLEPFSLFPLLYVRISWTNTKDHKSSSSPNKLTISRFRTDVKDSGNPGLRQSREKSGTSREAPRSFPPKMSTSSQAQGGRWGLQWRINGVLSHSKGAFHFWNISVLYPSFPAHFQGHPGKSSIEKILLQPHIISVSTWSSRIILSRRLDWVTGLLPPSHMEHSLVFRGKLGHSADALTPSSSLINYSDRTCEPIYVYLSLEGII